MQFSLSLSLIEGPVAKSWRARRRGYYHNSRRMRLVPTKGLFDLCLGISGFNVDLGLMFLVFRFLLFMYCSWIVGCRFLFDLLFWIFVSIILILFW